jgi:pimeloyl-ACP methyl ester carboxylesterase
MFGCHKGTAMNILAKIALVGASLVLGVISANAANAETETKAVTINEVEIDYMEHGQGTPVVFLHGLFNDHRQWLPQRDDVGARYRFIAYTQRYHGPRPWPDDGENYSNATHARDLAEFIRALDSGPVHIVARSNGGHIAMLMTLEHPGLVRSLVLPEPGGVANLVSDTPEGKEAIGAFREALAPARQAALAGDSDAATRYFYEAVAGRPGLWEALSEDRRQLMLPNGRMLRLFFSAPRTNISCDQLGQVRAPTLIVKGDRSIPMFQLFSDAVAGCMPGSQVVVIPNSGHGMSQQNPAAFNKALLEFLDRN